MRVRFLLNYLKEPDAVGAVVPSSRFLAKALCRHALGAEHLVELGAGTGAVTQHLHATFPTVPLVIVERDRGMAQALAQKFLDRTIVSEDVQQRPDLFQSVPEKTVVVSSLPFRCMPRDVVDQIGQVFIDFLIESAHRKVVQFSYGVREPFPIPHSALVWKREELILRNLPPAWVWTLRRAYPAAPANLEAEILLP